MRSGVKPVSRRRMPISGQPRQRVKQGSGAMARAEGRRREMVGILAILAVVLIAYREVAFAGKTFDTSALTAGVNGYDAATAPKVNAFRVDPGASAWQM